MPLEAQKLTPEQQAILGAYYRELYPKMLRSATAALANRSMAEVAVQDTFRIAAEKFAVLSRSDHPTGWLYATLRNCIKEARRVHNATLSRYVAWSMDCEPAEEMPLPSSLDLERNEDLKLLARMHVEGYSLEEIAAELGISIAALKMRMYRAKKRLREDPDLKKF